MQRYLIFDDATKQLKGFLEVATTIESEADAIGALEGLKIPADEFPVLAEGTTLQLNSDGTWGEVALPIEAAPAAPPDPEPLQTP